MGWTKKQLITEAFGELALASYEWDINPEEDQIALRRLDSMMSTWEARGVRVGYSFPSSPEDSSLDADSGVPDSANEAIFLNLAIRMAPGYGKQVSSDTKKAAREAFDLLLWQASHPIEQQMPSTMPRGSGNRIWRNSQRPYFNKPDDGPLDIAQGGDLEIKPE